MSKGASVWEKGKGAQRQWTKGQRGKRTKRHMNWETKGNEKREK